MPADNQNEHAPRGELGTHYRSKILTGISRVHRKRPTVSERLLWQALRGKQLAGLKFRRQHPIGSSIVDFYCHEKRLVIEVEGGIHSHSHVWQKDKARREIIERYGLRFIRLSAEEVEVDLEGALQKIRIAADE